MPVTVRHGDLLGAMTTEELLIHIKEQGFKLEQLCHAGVRNWQANMSIGSIEDTSNLCHEFGYGWTHREALFVCLNNIYYASSKSQMWAKQKIIRGLSSEDPVWKVTGPLDEILNFVDSTSGRINNIIPVDKGWRIDIVFPNEVWLLTTHPTLIGALHNIRRSIKRRKLS